MNDKEMIIKTLNRIMPSASVDVLEFMYFYLLECDPARKEKDV